MKALRTNSMAVRDQIKKHILECVTDPEGNGYLDVADASNRLYNEFDRVANYWQNEKRFPNMGKRFSDFLNGLPFSFEYSYADIENYLNSLGINPDGKKYSDEKMMDLYHHLIYNEMEKTKTSK